MAGGDGETAASLYARPTLEYYDRLVKLAREAKRDEIAKLTPLERYEIIRLRHRSTLAEMKPLDGRGYIKLAVNKGWWKGNDEYVDEETQLADIKVTGSSAWVDLGLDSSRVNGLSRILNAPDRKRYLRLYKEDEVWKVDTTSMHELANELMGRAMDRMGTGDKESIFVRWEEGQSGKEVPANIWDPPRR